MMSCRLGAVLLLISWNVWSLDAFNRFNIAMDKLSSCREYRVSGEYGYHDFFHMKSLNHSQLGKDETLHLKLFVSTESDAHVLLSVNSEPFLLANRDYEFVIGGWTNTRSTLRQKYKQGAELVANEEDKHLLDPFDLTPIEIIQTRHGRISVYVPGYKEEPILTFYDPVPFDINYLSFGTFGGYKGRWLYDCKLDDPEEESKNDFLLLNQKPTVVSLTKNKRPLRLRNAAFQFNVDVVSREEQFSILKGRLQFHLNATGSEVVLGNSIDIKTICLKNVKECPEDAFQCKVSDIEIKPVGSSNDLLDIRSLGSN